MIALTVEKRDIRGKHTKTLRAAGKVPAVVYGPKQESLSLTLSLKEFEKVFKDAGESSVVALEGAAPQPISVLIHEIDHDPVTSEPRHIDFYAIEKGAKVMVAVPLVFVGESAAVKAGAILTKVLHEVEVEAEATHLPREITVDISVLANNDDQIHIRDISLPAGVTLTSAQEEVVALVQEAQEETEETVDAPDMETVKVEKKGKQGEEESEAK